MILHSDRGITGRISKDATTRKGGNDKQVVNFSIAINDSCKPKGNTEFYAQKSFNTIPQN